MQSNHRKGLSLVVTCIMSTGGGGVYRKRFACPENPFGIKPGQQRDA